MIFVDADVFIYGAGGEHPFKQMSREFFDRSALDRFQLATSAKVLQELMYAYLPAYRFDELGSAMAVISRYGIEVWPLERDDVMLAWQLRAEHPHLSARDHCHLASCRRRDVSDMMTFDQSLRAAFGPI